MDKQKKYDAEAKAILNQVKGDFDEQRQQIFWLVLKQPTHQYNREQALRTIGFGITYGIIFCIVIWWFLNEYLLIEEVKKEVSKIMLFSMSIALFLSGLLFIFSEKLLPNMVPFNHQAHYIHLDFMKQTVTLIRANYQYPITYSFKSQSLFRKVKLPAFQLPNTETNQYRQLAQQLQRKISDLTGLEFE